MNTINNNNINGTSDFQAIISIYKRSISVFAYFFFGSMVLSGVNEMARINCKTGEPHHDYMKYDPNALPYSKPKVVNTAIGGQVAFITSIFKYFMTHTGKYVDEGDKDINMFYRKTYNIYNDWFADSLIYSWSNMRRSLFQIIETVQPYLGLDKIHTANNNPYNVTTLEGLKQSFIELTVFTFTSKLLFIFACYGTFMGMYNLYVGGLFGTPMNKSLTALVFPLLLVLLILISIGLFFIQFIHNFLIIPYTSFTKRNDKNGLFDVMKYALYKYMFYFLLVLGYIVNTESENSNTLKNISYLILCMGCFMFTVVNTNLLSFLK